MTFILEMMTTTTCHFPLIFSQLVETSGDSLSTTDSEGNRHVLRYADGDGEHDDGDYYKVEDDQNGGDNNHDDDYYGGDGHGHYHHPHRHYHHPDDSAYDNVYDDNDNNNVDDDDDAEMQKGTNMRPTVM